MSRIFGTILGAIASVSSIIFFDVDRFAVVVVHQQEVDELAVFANFFCKYFRFSQGP